MAFIEDARHSGRSFYVSPDRRLPRHYYTWATIAVSLGLWAVMILTVLHPF